MKKIILIAIMVILTNVSIGQSMKVFIDGKLSSMEEVSKLPNGSIASMNKSVEDGVPVVRIILKKTVDTTLVKDANAPKKVILSGDKEERAAQMLTQIYDQTTLLKAGDNAANFTADKYIGAKKSLSDYKNKVVLINFWGTWCAPCLRELAPEGLPQILKKFENNPDFVFLPIAHADTNKSLDSFFATPNGKTIYNYLKNTTLLDSDKSILLKYAKSGVPRSIVVDRDGKIVFGSLGANDEILKKMEEAISNALK